MILDLKQLAADLNTQVQVSAFTYVPQGMAGVETIGRELQEQLPDGIDDVFSPAAGGGLTLAVARGIQSTKSLSQSPKTPTPLSLLDPRASLEDGGGGFGSGSKTRRTVHCVQPAGNNTIAGPLREGAEQAQSCECTTSISGLQVASVIDGHETLRACRASGGTGYLVEDEHVFEMQRRLAREEGIFCEPAGAVALAGAAEAFRMGELRAESTVVCLVTGSGFKDNASVEKMPTDGLHSIVDSVEQFAESLRK